MNRMERTLNFVSWNTCGIKSKLPTLLDKFNTLHAEIVYIQETHVGPKCCSLLENVRGWRVYFTVHKPNSKGVAILIRDKVPFKYICHDEDYNGGYIVLFCHLYGELFTLVNVYNHKHDKEVLGRLKDYLREVAEGVLVIGGDFNTVLHPVFDRQRSAALAVKAASKDILENFTASLNLIDTWSHLHPTDKKYTRSQNDSRSRIDMFFIPEKDMDRVISCKIIKTANEPKISDHHPLILKLRVQQQATNKFPSVASEVVGFGYIKEPHRRPEKINGAEILSAIKSLTDSGERRPNRLSLDGYKRFCSPLSEILKIFYNDMLKNKHVTRIFKKSYHKDGRHTFNVDYLIFSLILAKRLTVFRTPPFKRRKKAKLDVHLKVTFAELPKNIKSSFLKECYDSLKPAPSASPPNFSFLMTFLPRMNASKDHRLLLNGCPLTRTILTLTLKQLVYQIHKTESKAYLCRFRQTVIIYTDNDEREKVESLVNNFENYSGIKLIITKRYPSIK